MLVAARTHSPIQQGSGRLEFANDIANHPLAARVIVNRVWKWHFGTGIVNTPDNFGVMGDKPSNPELLEYLASEFVGSRPLDQVAAARDHALGRLPHERGRVARSARQRRRPTASTRTSTASVSMPKSCATACCSPPAISI